MLKLRYQRDATRMTGSGMWRSVISCTKPDRGNVFLHTDTDTEYISMHMVAERVIPPSMFNFLSDKSDHVIVILQLVSRAGSRATALLR